MFAFSIVGIFFIFIWKFLSLLFLVLHLFLLYFLPKLIICSYLFLLGFFNFFSFYKICFIISSCAPSLVWLMLLQTCVMNLTPHQITLLFDKEMF